MEYLSTVALLGTLVAGISIILMFATRRVTKESLPLILVVIFFALRAFRDHSLLLPGMSNPFLFHLYDATMLTPYFIYLWITRRQQSSVKFQLLNLWPYGYQLVLIVCFFLPAGLIGSNSNSIFVIMGDAILVFNLVFYYWKLRKLNVKLRLEESVILYGCLLSLGFQVFVMEFLLVNFTFSLGFKWSVLHSSQLVLKSLYIFLSSYVLYQLYGINPFKSRAIKPGNVDVDEKAILDFKKNELFLNPDLKLENAARDLKISRAVLTKSILTFEKKNFTDFVNDLRLDYFFKLVNERAYLKLSIMGMAESSGFKSKATFNRVFKGKMEITPSQYIKQREMEANISLGQV